MKRRLFFVALTVVGFSSTLPAVDSPALRAGAAAVDLRQGAPLNMPGGFSANLAQSAHDPLFSRALVLDDGTTALAMVVIDSLGAAPEVLEEAKAIAAERTEIPAERMLVASTHTHTGPPSNATSGPAPAIAYRKLLVEGIAQSIIQAHGALQTASIGAAAHPLPDEVFNRRWYLKAGQMPLNPFGKLDTVKMNPGTSPDVLERPAGPTDPDITVLSVTGREAQTAQPLRELLIALCGRISAGADLRGLLRRVRPADAIAPRRWSRICCDDVQRHLGRYRRYSLSGDPAPARAVRADPHRGPKAADTSWFAYRKIKHRPDVRIGMRQREISLRYRRPTAEQVAEAKAVLAVTAPEEIEKQPRLAQNYARNVISAAERKEETLTVKLQAIRIGGEMAVCGIPFETFVEIGLDLKKRQPFCTDDGDRIGQRPGMVICPHRSTTSWADMKLVGRQCSSRKILP